jgi:glycerol-1-phosphate dehydrogenase [NAD(P)+]
MKLSVLANLYAQKSLDDAGIESVDAYVFSSEDFYAEWKHIEVLKAFLENIDAVAIAVGSGVINDTVKYVSSLLGRRYMCVGTAASMDGFTAYGASITKDGNKQTFDCPAPLGFVMDSAIAAAAPKELAASGYADLIAKIPAGADWMLAEVVGSEKIDAFAWNLVQDGLKESLADPAAVFAGDVEKTQALAEGLLMSGFAMQAIQSSRPASGTEHQFSHCWDMEDLCYDGKHVSHGFKVGIGTLISTAELEFILEKGLEDVDVETCVQAWKSWEDMEDEIREVMAGKPGHIARGLTETKGKYVDKDGLRTQIIALKEAWPELSQKIREQIIPFETVRESLRLVGAPYEPEMIGVSRERFRKTVSYIPYMRSRFTNIDVIYRLGWMDEFLERMFGLGGGWEQC